MCSVFMYVTFRCSGLGLMRWEGHRDKVSGQIYLDHLHLGKKHVSGEDQVILNSNSLFSLMFRLRISVPAQQKVLPLTIDPWSTLFSKIWLLMSTVFCIAEKFKVIVQVIFIFVSLISVTSPSLSLDISLFHARDELEVQKRLKC